MTMILHGYWRSSASYRVRIALNLKGLDWIHRGVNLVQDGGEHKKQNYSKLNPQQLVPSLEIDGEILTQSVAIMEYLEEMHPEPALLPNDPTARSWVRSLAHLVACDIHPLNNLRVLSYLQHQLGVGESAKGNWYKYWICNGFDALEKMLSTSRLTGDFCHGNLPTLADCCLIPQIYNARRFNVDTEPYPIIRRIDKNCQQLKAFIDATPENQPDAL